MKLFNFCKYSFMAAVAAIFLSCGSDDNTTDSTPNWVNTGETNCSTSSTSNVGSNGQYYFYQQQDRNQNSSSYEKFKWVADPSKDGYCSGEYSPTFGSTNIASGSYISFATYGDKVFAAETKTGGIMEFVNGTWTAPTGMDPDIKNDIFYAKMKAGANGKFFISCSNGIYFQTGDNNYKPAFKSNNNDMAGGLGGSNTNFFASAGAGWDGIFKWNEAGQNFVKIDGTTGCYYSIEALSETEVFFGSASKSGGTDGLSYGVRRYNGSAIVNTNITSGEYNLTVYNNKMYAASSGTVHVWNGSSFVAVYDKGGKLCMTGNALYLTNSSGIYKFNGTTFELMLEGNYEGRDVLSYEGRLYAFGTNGVKVYYNQEWSTISSSPSNVTTGVASTPGLFVGGKGNDAGIQKMVKNYN